MSKKCIQCGAELEDEAMFCDECGAKQIVEPPKAPKEDKPKPEKTKAPKPKKEKKEKPVDEGPKNTKAGVASLVLGIIAVCTVGVFFIPQVLGLVLGIIAVQNKNSKHNFAIIGIVLSVVSFLLFILMFYVGLQDA